MEIVLASQVDNENVKNQISKIFVEGFYEWIKFFSKDKNILEQAFHICEREELLIAKQTVETILDIDKKKEQEKKTVR